LSYCFLSVCGLLGLALMLKRRVEGAGLFALVFVLLPLPYYLITVQPRFRAPMEPLIAILAVYLFRSAETGKIWSGALWKRD
jgi:asparagine N-glycosylation enzyme membrane subunit Stt3